MSVGRSLLCRAGLGAANGRSHFVPLFAFLAAGFLFVTIWYGYRHEGERRWKDVFDGKEEGIVIKAELFPVPETAESE